MSEWLTIGQMIDKMKVGDVAECSSKRYVTLTEDGHMQFCDKNGNYKCFLSFHVTKPNRESKYRILHKFVTFEEAIKAFKEGKTIKSWTDNDYEIHYGEYLLNNLTEETITFNEILNAKWTIED